MSPCAPTYNMHLLEFEKSLMDWCACYLPLHLFGGVEQHQRKPSPMQASWPQLLGCVQSRTL
jgi:hypothetical protein